MNTGHWPPSAPGSEAPDRTVFYCKPETGVHTTEMMIYHRLIV